MKKLIYLFVSAFICASCNGGNNGYTVTGTVEGAVDGDVVYLAKIENRQLVKVDSAIITNSLFTFTGQQDTVANYSVFCQPAETGKGLAMDFFLENGKIQLSLSAEEQSARGTFHNDIYQEIREQQKAVAAKGKDDDEIEDLTVELNKEKIKENIDNYVGVHLLKGNYYYMDVEELDPLMSQIPTEYANDATIVRIKENVEKLKKTAVGQPFTDFEMNTPEGEPVKLSDYVGKGKVVLVDFWASWCPPCRREMPSLVELYANYKNKNFEIVGVSLDRDAESWKKGIQDLNITWPQMSDIKFWDCEGAKLYAVSSIPHTVLIDGDGIIIARNLHSEALKEKLDEILK